jgi:hypothetical protein
MNRRTFIERLALGTAAFAILPGAGRVWRAEREILVARMGVIPANVNDAERWCSVDPLPGLNMWGWREGDTTFFAYSEHTLRPTSDPFVFRATPRELRLLWNGPGAQMRRVPPHSRKDPA